MEVSSQNLGNSLIWGYPHLTQVCCEVLPHLQMPLALLDYLAAIHTLTQVTKVRINKAL